MPTAVVELVAAAVRARAGEPEDLVRRAVDLELERERVAASKRARLELTPHTTANQGGRIVARVSVRNFGPAVANDVRVWLVDTHDLAASEPAGGEITLDVGQESERLRVLVDEGIAEQDLRMLRWYVEWTDDDEGLHQRDSRRRPP